MALVHCTCFVTYFGVTVYRTLQIAIIFFISCIMRHQIKDKAEKLHCMIIISSVSEFSDLMNKRNVNLNFIVVRSSVL